MKQENQTSNSVYLAAITAKYLGATETRGSRIKVTSQRGSRVFPYPHEYSGAEVYAHCVAQYLEFIRQEDRKVFNQPEYDGWGSIADYAMGVLPTGEHVFVSVR